MAWLNFLGIGENLNLHNINNIQNIITFKFKEKMWDENDLEVGIKIL